MVLDPTTILVVHLLIFFLVSVSYYVTWLDARRERALLWLCGGTLAAGLGVIIRFALPQQLDLILSNGLVEVAGLCLWFACRQLRGVAIWPVLLPVPLLMWCVFSLLPFFGSIGPRVVCANLVLGLIFMVAGREVWVVAPENPALRFYMTGLLWLQAGVYSVWAGYNLFSPPPDQTHFLLLPGLVVTDLVSLVTTLLIAIGFIGLVRDRSVRSYRLAAILDSVTGIENRRAFDESLAGWMTKTARRGQALALIMLDIDHFKSYNDHYGHPQGDACLRQVAQVLKTVVTSAGGSIYRYGGEEFVALVSLSNRAAIGGLAAQLSQSVRDLRLTHETQSTGIVTVSMGVGLAEPPSCPEPSRLLSVADEALYQAKRGGRDRIIILAEGQEQAASPASTIATI